MKVSHLSNSILAVLALVLSLQISGCASSSGVNDDEDELIALEEEAESLEEEVADEEDYMFEGDDEEEEGVAEEDAEDEGEEFAEEDVEEEGEEFAEEDAEGEEFAEEDDAAEEDEFAEEEVAEEEPQEEPEGEMEEELQAEEEAFEEEPMEEELQAVEEPQEIEEEQPYEEVAGDPGMGGDSVDITGIEFRSNESGGTVVIETSAPVEYQQRANSETNQFIVEIPNSNLPESLKRPFIMKEFASASFQGINAYQDAAGGTARIVIQMAGAGQPTVQQEGTAILIMPGGDVLAANEEAPMEELEPAPEVQTPEPQFEEAVSPSGSGDGVLAARTLEEFLTEGSKYYGRPVSVEFRNATVRDVIDFLSTESGVNMVVSDEVKGRVTVKLRQVPWDQALVVVMKAKNLGYIRQGSIIRIATLKELKFETQLAKEMVESQKKVVPLKVKVMPISYADVKELLKQVRPFLTKSRGEVVQDQRTSSLIIRDVPDVLRKITRLVKELDIPPAQVMIESKIVEAGEQFQKRVGISWGLNGGSVQAGSGGNGPLEIAPSLNIRPTNQKNLGVSAGSFGLNIGTLDFFGDFDAALELAERDSIIKIISSPRVIVVNKEEAEIRQVGQVISLAGLQDQSGNVSTQVQRTPVELKLKVTPQITAGGSVIMDVEVNRQFAGPLLDLVTLARAVNGREAKTKVLVQNGETAVIGGIYQTDESETTSGVPGLKDIPVLGWLFKDNTKERIKNELLIFLTPRIIDNQRAGNVEG